ncbi:MAG: type 1 glutamine amidotransferase [Halobacteriaceae archaeon]
MRLHYLQHVPFEPPGAIETWARERGHDIEGTHLYRGDALPDPAAFDWLVVLGGPMGVYDADEYPWLVDEQRLVRAAVDADRAVLGVCLGPQQVAAALGADVYPAEPEIGWGTVEATPGAAGTPFADLPAEYEVLHWHGDTFDLPDGATRTARTPATENQAYVYGDRVVGVQFHLESTPDTVEALLSHTEALPAGPHVQDRAAIRGGADRTGRCHDHLRAVLENIESVLETAE